VLAESDRHCYMNVVLKALAATLTINGCMPIDRCGVKSHSIWSIKLFANRFNVFLFLPINLVTLKPWSRIWDIKIDSVKNRLLYVDSLNLFRNRFRLL
jgi:hypothetical protein